MTDSIVVKIAESIEGLSHDKGCLGFCQMLSLGDVEEELSSFAKPIKG